MFGDFVIPCPLMSLYNWGNGLRGRLDGQSSAGARWVGHQQLTALQGFWTSVGGDHQWPLTSNDICNDIWVCLKIVYPYTQWLMIIIPIKNGYFIGVYPIFRHTHMQRWGRHPAACRHNISTRDCLPQRELPERWGETGWNGRNFRTFNWPQLELNLNQW